MKPILFITICFAVCNGIFVFQVADLKRRLTQLERGVSDYNYIMSSRGQPQIGMTPDGKAGEGTHVIRGDDYLKEREAEKNK